MRLLRTDETGESSLTEDLPEDRLPPYAILSHRWLADTEESTFEDLVRSTGKEKLGYKKLQFCGEQARQDGIAHFWVDTCCINKANKAELAHAIKCMFRWYQNASVCYVYSICGMSPAVLRNSVLPARGGANKNGETVNGSHVPGHSKNSLLLELSSSSPVKLKC